MKFKSVLSLLTLMAPVAAFASIGPPACVGTGCDYSYALTFTGLQISDPGTGPVLTEDTSNTWSLGFDWVGPYRFNSPPNSFVNYSFNGAPVSGWTFTGVSFSSNGPTDTFIDINFQDSIPGDVYNGSTAHYHVTGTDAFWASIGSQAFDPTNAYSDGTIVEGGNSTAFDPPCTDCLVSLTTSPSPSAVPEPGSWLLLGTLVAGLGLKFGKRFAA